MNKSSSAKDSPKVSTPVRNSPRLAAKKLKTSTESTTLKDRVKPYSPLVAKDLNSRSEKKLRKLDVKNSPRILNAEVINSEHETQDENLPPSRENISQSLKNSSPAYESVLQTPKKLALAKENVAQISSSHKNVNQTPKSSSFVNSPLLNENSSPVNENSSSAQSISTEEFETLRKELARKSREKDEILFEFKMMTHVKDVECDSLRRRLKETDSDVSRLTTQCKDNTCQLEKLESDISTLRVENTELRKDSSELRLECSELRAHAGQQRAELAQLHESSVQLRLVEKELREQCEGLKESNSALNIKLCEQQKELEKQYSHQIEKLIEENNSLKDSIEDSRKHQQSELALARNRYDKHALGVANDFKLKTNQLVSNITTLQNSLSKLREDYDGMKRFCIEVFGQRSKIVQFTSDQITQSLLDVSQTNSDLVRKYTHEVQLRKSYHNQLVELRGNIRVFCRVRPTVSNDGVEAGSRTIVTCETDEVTVNVVGRNKTHSYELDRVFDPSSTQQQVFCEVESLIQSCLDGYNVCIFAYGQTGAGKTYTMEGPASDPGINQRALLRLFDEACNGLDWDYSISVSMLEIYNNVIRDLLSGKDKLEIKMKPEGGLHVPGLSCFYVRSAEDVNKVMEIGHSNRATAATNMNELSSRSHAILIVDVERVNKTTGTKFIGRMNLIDLAGSESVSKSGTSGARLAEAKSINLSLASLGDVIHALRAKQAHVPYRNSTLTRLLENSLGGNSKTLMIVQVSPVDKNSSETIASLGFAQRIRSVELGPASRRVET